MGFLSRITLAFKSNTPSSKSLIDGDHTIDRDRLSQATDSQAVNPLQHGDWSTIKSAPFCEQPRYFSKEEKQALHKIALQKHRESKYSHKAYEALALIEKADARVHRGHRKYLSEAGRAELSKKRADARAAESLHKLRPGYAAIGRKLDQSDKEATNKVNSIRQVIGEFY